MSVVVVSDPGSRHAWHRIMRLKSGIWVAAYIRRCQVEGAQAVLRRRGAEEAGAVFIKVSSSTAPPSLWPGAAERLRRGAAGRPRVHPQPEDGRRRPRPTRRPIWRARSSSIPTSGSSRSRIAPAGIFSIRSWRERVALGAVGLVRLDELVPGNLGPRHRQAACAALALFVLPILRLMGGGARCRDFSAGWLACQIATSRSAASGSISSCSRASS